MQAVYYRASDASEPVNDFIDALSERTQAAIDNQIERLNMQTVTEPPLPFPHTSQVRGGLRELRCHYGNDLYRILHRRSDKFWVLLHMFRKDTGRVPEGDIVVAERRWRDFKARMNAIKRTPPRAAGHDAP